MFEDMAPCSSESCSSAEVERIFSAHLVRSTAGARAKARDRDRLGARRRAGRRVRGRF